MYINHTHKFIFLCLPNSASRAVKSWLAERYRIRLNIQHHNFIIPKSLQGYFTFAVVRNPYSKAVSNWSWVRKKRVKLSKRFPVPHPFWSTDPSFSEYAEWLNLTPRKMELSTGERNKLNRKIHRIRTKETQNEFEHLVVSEFNLDSRTLTNSHQLGFAHHVDQIIKLEDLDAGISSLPFVSGPAHVEKKGENVRDLPNWLDYYDKKTEQNIYKYFKEDFDKFGYERIATKPPPKIYY